MKFRPMRDQKNTFTYSLVKLIADYFKPLQYLHSLLGVGNRLLNYLMNYLDNQIMNRIYQMVSVLC